MNLGRTRLRKRTRNRWQDEMRRGWTNNWWRRVEGNRTPQRGMEEAPENGKESSHSAHADGMNE